MTEYGRACALTGHRDLPPDFDCGKLHEALGSLLDGGCDTFFCGMARGFDLAALGCLADLRQRKRFYIEACVPYRGQERNFSAAEKAEYDRLLSWCDRTTVLFPGYRPGCFLMRDRYMVDCADFVFAYCTRAKGGTAYTVGYAEKTGKRVILFS